MPFKKIQHSSIAPTSRSMGPHVKQVIPSGVEHLDPFVFLDHFGPFEKTPNFQGVPPHPHAGIATITYLIEGSNRHVDSYGHDAMVEQGDLAWMQAGKGIVHAEGINDPNNPSKIIHGLQLWISLPAKDKFIEPDFFHYKSADLPQFAIESAEIKVLVGEIFNHISPVESLSPAYIFEIKQKANSTIEIPIKKGYTSGIYLIDGELISDNKTLTSSTITKFEEKGETIQINALQDAHYFILGGEPLNEPIVAYASFVMNSKAQIQQVIDAYHNGEMGTINE
jgi:redox-sensitive bicupin YhaK (pirin superfamily)